MHGYNRLSTEYYDIDKPRAPEDALAFYLRYAEQAGGPILEPMCGSGRFLIPLMQRGYDIDGVDASPHMLQACRERCEALGLAPMLREQYLHELDMPCKYRLVMITAGSFSLLTDPIEARQSLRRIHAHLLPGAKLVLEAERLIDNRPSKGWPWGGRWVERPDGAKIILSWLGYYSAEERISRDIHRYELVKDGHLLETEFEEFALRFYDPAEFRALLTECGFTTIQTYRTYALEPPSDTDETIVFEGTRA